MPSRALTQRLRSIEAAIAPEERPPTLFLVVVDAGHCEPDEPAKDNAPGEIVAFFSSSCAAGPAVRVARHASESCDALQARVRTLFPDYRVFMAEYAQP